MKSDGVEYCCITADKLRLSQILINILSNAVKYTEEGGNITFEIKEIKVTNPQIVKYKFIISDNGIGMSEEYLKDISDGKLYSSNDMVKVGCHDCIGCSAY